MLHITIVVDPSSGSADALGGAGPIEIRSNLFQLGSVDSAAVDSRLTIGGREFVISMVDVKPGSGDDQAVTISIAPIERDPFEQTREEKQPEW